MRGRVAAALLAGAGALALVLSTVPAPAAASSTTITVLAGSATVTNGTGSRSALSGDLVRPGDRVRTSADGHAVLTFIDGSTMVIEPSGSVVLEEATFGQGSVAVRVFQSVGLTWSSVSRLLAPGSRFEVRTPAVTATVRGTAFEVEVAVDGGTRVRTSEGSVAVSNDDGEVIVGEGAETTVQPSRAPSPPAPPPPATRRTLEIGDRAVVIIDATGRGCGIYAGKVLQQIPGCVVRGGSIEIRDTDRLGLYRLAVTEDVGPDTSVVERTTAARPGAVEAVRLLQLPAAELGASPVQVAPGGTTVDVALPLVGTIPVQMEVTTARPVVPVTVAATAPPPSAVAQLSLPPLPFPAPTVTALAPTVAPPTVTTPSPLATLAQSATPTVAPLTPAPTAEPTVAPTPTPTPTPILTVPSLLPSATPTPTPEPTAQPTPTPTPSSSPTPTPTPRPVPPPLPPSNAQASVLLGTVTVTWDPSSTVLVTYDVERGPCSGTATTIARLALSPYADTPGTGSFLYQIRAVGTDGQKSDPASTSCISVP